MTATSKTVSGAELPSRLAEAPGRIRLEPVSGEVVVTMGDIQIARTRNAIRLHEGDYTPMIYVPATDTDFSGLTKTDHTTYCPLKGAASYYSVTAAGEPGVNAVWTYEDPFAEWADIKDHLAFYTDRIKVEEH
ncbi:DUF427 domain-containing protein [Pyruvatibacter sp.]|uniref:DUF427 domain-containing protein n=1 Tax=unclassified Pyruvatibacter TaxID=2618840 RepID=UPI0029684B08|nr:DUF427 domain-containing protein [Alphaproteobacteria bacterium]